MLFDIHGDIWTDVTVKRLMGETQIIKKYHLERFRKGGQIGGIFVIWMDPPNDKRPRERLVESLNAMNDELAENMDLLSVVCTRADFYRALSENKLAVVLGVEGLSGIGEDVDSIHSLHRMGVRHMGLTWNEENALDRGEGKPCTRADAAWAKSRAKY